MKKDKEKDKDKKKKREKRVEEPIEQKEPVKIQPAPQEPEAPPPEKKPANGAAALDLVMNQVGGKWKLRILWSLRDGQGKRYSVVKTDIPVITDMMLSQSLRELCADGLIRRNQYQEIPPRVEYQITEKGSGIVPAIQALISWAQKMG